MTGSPAAKGRSHRFRETQRPHFHCPSRWQHPSMLCIRQSDIISVPKICDIARPLEMLALGGCAARGGDCTSRNGPSPARPRPRPRPRLICCAHWRRSYCSRGRRPTSEIASARTTTTSRRGKRNTSSSRREGPGRHALRRPGGRPYDADVIRGVVTGCRGISR